MAEKAEEDKFTPQTEETAVSRTTVKSLHLKIPGQDLPFVSFTYSLPPWADSSVPQGWNVLVTENVDSQHIRCHELQPTDQLSSLIPEFQKAYAVAVVLINVDDSYNLPEACLQGVEELPIPVAVLTHADGQILLKQLDYHKWEDVLTCLGAESPIQQTQKEVVPWMRSSQKELRVGTRLRHFFGTEKRASCVYDLKGEIKGLMFHSCSGEPLAVCKDTARFTILMSVFRNYEKYAKADSHHSEVNDTLKTLMQHFPQTFAEDFPFYIVVAYRMHLKQHLYQCEELSNFIISCIDRMEVMDPHIIAKNFNDFLLHEDFNVMFGVKQSNLSVFHLLELSCMELGVTVSYEIHMQGVADKSKLYLRFVYHRMLWLSLALRIHSKRGVVTQKTQHFWKEYLIVHQGRLEMDPPTVSDLMQGLVFGSLIHLPPDLTFSSEHMAALLVSYDHVHPFQHVSNYITAVDTYIPREIDFLHFITELRAAYDCWLKQPGTHKLTKVSVSGTLTGTLQEGLAFLDTLYAICQSKRNSELDVFDVEMTKWLTLLLQLVDITGPSPETHLKAFLTGRRGVVKKYRRHISTYVINTARENFGKMSIQQFFPLYKDFIIWPHRLLEEYLQQYVLPSDMRISDPIWKAFFSEVVERFEGAKYQCVLLDFLRKVAESYLQDTRAAEFVLDLLLLDIPMLFAIASDEREDDVASSLSVEFVAFLTDYITRNSLGLDILRQMKDIINSVSDEPNEFQMLVLQVLQKEVVSDLKALQGSQETELLAVVRVTINMLIKDLSWLQALTAKQRFCWGIVGLLCAEIPISSDQFEWVQSYAYLITQLGFIYNAYCNGRQLEENERLLSEHLPVEISSGPSEEVRRYFVWVRRVQGVLVSWRDRFLQMKVNYDDLMLYASTQTLLNHLGFTVCATSVVIETSDIQRVKNMILQNFEKLNALLIKYVLGHPEAQWCTLPQLLDDFGVTLPAHLLDPISQFVQFPGQEKVFTDPLAIPLPPDTLGVFQPGQDICVKISKSLHLCNLIELVQGLEQFLQPLLDHLGMLVFFKLHRSEIFDKYTRLKLKKERCLLPQYTCTPTVTASPAVISTPAPFIPTFPQEIEESDSGTPVPTLVCALTQTKVLLERLTQGKATAYAIVAGGDLNLGRFNVDKEIEALTEFFAYLNQPLGEQTLSSVQSMLQLTSLVRGQGLSEQGKLDAGYEERLKHNVAASPLSTSANHVAGEQTIENTHLKEKMELKEALLQHQKESHRLEENLLQQQEEMHNLKESLLCQRREMHQLEENQLCQQKVIYRLEVTLLRQRKEKHFLEESLLHQQQESQMMAQREHAHQEQVTQLEHTLQQQREHEKEVQELAANREQDLRHELQKLGEQAASREQELQQQMEQLRQQGAHEQEEADRVHRDQIAELHAEIEKLQVASSQEVEFWKIPRQDVTVLGEIGSGAWGVVNKGVFHGQEVAVKRPHRTILSARNINRLRREVRIMAQVRHPNLLLFIAAVFNEQVDKLEEPPLIVMELLEIDLRAAYEQGRLEDSSKLPIFHNIASALNYLHKHQEPIIHRDVSAPNVLLEALPGNKWRAKLSDFGSANLAKVARTAGEGAVIYTAPEAFPIDIHDPNAKAPLQTTKIDVYSYGVLLCEVVTNQLPLEQDYRDMLQQVQRQWLSMYDIITACTRRNPEERPTMADLLSQLK